MKNDEQNGLARVDPTTPPKITTPIRRSDVKRTSIRPGTQEITPTPLMGTEKVKTELEAVLVPIFEQMADQEFNASREVVNNLIPRAIAARSALTETNIAANVRSYATEVADESLATFQGIDKSNSEMLTSMVNSLFAELCPG